MRTQMGPNPARLTAPVRAPAKLQEVLAGVGAAIDALGGRFTMQYIAVVVTATRTGAA